MFFLFPSLNQETPETPDININQEEQQVEQDQDLRADSSPCHSQTPRTYLQILEPTGQGQLRDELYRKIFYGLLVSWFWGWHRKEQLDVSVTIVKDIEKRKDILQEVEVLELIRGHENVIGYYGAYYQRASVKKPHYEGLWISMERWNGVAVEDLIYTSEQYSLHESWIAYICKEVLKGLCHLENKKVIHHDLRPQNIILTTSADVKISDFSSATIGEMSHSTSGRIPYLAPEVLANFGKKTIWYNSKADIWSLGISALQMAEGYYPFSIVFPQQNSMKRYHARTLPPVIIVDKMVESFQLKTEKRERSDNFNIHSVGQLAPERSSLEAVCWKALITTPLHLRLQKTPDVNIEQEEPTSKYTNNQVERPWRKDLDSHACNPLAHCFLIVKASRHMTMVNNNKWSRNKSDSSITISSTPCHPFSEDKKDITMVNN
ncbi:mitogen-activated protein kinase kinase kinase kinase 4-like [Xenopus laevis]|uniref:Mitogen-activated protein kinase kinase kinase kinase 4-like n=1 Tax=Xenopus laevis TaxID=8355 RepID=A0A8J1M6C5_XENLA|nr:mitogen-activated protein kinase kinase kinase kinase 4-like [Xenopus laevis]